MNEELKTKIEQMLSDDFACTRVWEAWQVGTMTQDDFVQLSETERVDELLALFESEKAKEVAEARIDELRLVDAAYHHIIEMKSPVSVQSLVDNNIEHIILDDPRTQNDLFRHVQDRLAQLTNNPKENK